jgi:hypothetical protein
METSEPVGSVAELWRFPVKSMGGERLEEAEVTERGVLGDPAYALVDMDTGRVVSAVDAPPVQISLPNGTMVRSDSGDADRLLSAHFKRNVSLRRAAPEDFTIDQYHPDVEGADPGGHRDTVVPQPLGSALFAALGAESPVPVGSFMDVFPMWVLTSATRARLREAPAPEPFRSAQIPDERDPQD